jgi:hypothetical protein
MSLFYDLAELMTPLPPPERVLPWKELLKEGHLQGSLLAEVLLPGGFFSPGEMSGLGNITSGVSRLAGCWLAARRDRTDF